MGRTSTLVCTVASAHAAAGTAPAHSQLTARLVANDDIYAQHQGLAPGIPTWADVRRAGPLTSASVEVLYGSGSFDRVHYDIDLAPDGDGWRLDGYVETGWGVPYGFAHVSVHADLTLTLAGPPGLVVGLLVENLHGGDCSDPNAFRIDLGDDGTTELWSAAQPGGSSTYWGHRVWTWDFANGPLPIRVRSDGFLWCGAQGYRLDLRIVPWIPEAQPAGPDCGGISRIGGPSYFEDTNYQLVPIPSPVPGELAVLRASGLGSFGAYVVASGPSATPFSLPSPFPQTCDVLIDGFWFGAGAVEELSYLSPWPSPPQPRTWRLHVPALPPGLSLHVQHVSAMLQPPFPFGATNRVRIDT